MEIVIVGGGYAGVACATRLGRRARAQGTPARIRLINPQPVLVERIRLHQVATGQSLRKRRVDGMLRRCGVEYVAGCATRIDPVARTVQAGAESIHWDRLVLALGSFPDMHAVPGVAEYAQTLDPARAAEVCDQLMALSPGARVVVVGGGLTGIEAASEIAESFPHLQVHLVAHGEVAHDFSAAARRHVLDTLQRRLRITVHEHWGVKSVAAQQLLSGEGSLPFDLCIWAAGFAVPSLPRDAGVRVNARGQVLVDPLLRSVSHPAIFAAGDIAAPLVPPGQHVPMGCKSAMPMGAQAADNLACELAGQAGRAFDYALLFYCVSLGRRDGLVQWADDEGRLVGRILTGRRGAWFKEMICLSTWWALQWEAKGIRAVVWKRTGHAPQDLASQAGTA